MILKSVHAAGEAGPAPLEYAITDWARGWAVALQEGLPDRLQGEALALEAAACLRRDEERWARAAARARTAIGKLVSGSKAIRCLRDYRLSSNGFIDVFVKSYFIIILI